MLMLSIGGLGGWVMRGSLQASPGGLAALAQEAAYSYSVYAPDRVRPVEMRASDSAQLVQWVSNRLNQPVKLPDLTGSGYRLMGGRLIATSHGPAAMFMYDDDRGDRLVVLTRPMTTEQSAPMAPHSGGDVSGFAWADGGMGYSLVGQAAAESSSRSPTRSAGRRARSRISTAGYRPTKTIVPTINAAAMNSSTAGKP